MKTSSSQSPFIPGYRVALQQTAAGQLPVAFNGKFDAWAFAPITEAGWFHQFYERVLSSIGRSFLPVYRLADGEFRYLLGRRVQWEGPSPIRDCVAVAAERLGLTNRRKVTSWGEGYDQSGMKDLRRRLRANIQTIASEGYLAAFLNDNGTATAHEYRIPFCKFLQQNGINLSSNNYIPFHFVCETLCGPSWEEFLRNRRILVVTGLAGKDPKAIQEKLLGLGAKDVQFLGISTGNSMLDRLDTSLIQRPVDLCLVSAGVGSANILLQLRELETAALDIGGYLHCLENDDFVAHSVFKAPRVKTIC